MLGISTLNVSNTDGKHLLTLIRCLQIAPWQSHPLVIVVQIAKNEERTSHSRENFRAKTFLEFPFLVKKILLILYEIYYCQTAYFPKLGRNIQKITLNLSKIKSAHFPFNPLDVIKILSPECTFKQHDLGKTAPLISCCLLLSNTQNLLFYEGGPCHIGTVHRFAFKSMDCFCMTGTSVMKELKLFLQIVSLARVKYNNKTMLIVKNALFLIKTLVFLKIYLSLQSISSCTLNHFPGIWMIDIVCNCIVGYCHIRIRGRLNSSTNSLPTN